VDGIYHQQVMQRALAGRVSGRALGAMTRANLGQDSPVGLLHYAWHFDNSLFAEGLAYMEACRAEAARASEPGRAWAAFGRLAHAAQDFYSHSNYVALWHGQFPAGAAPPPDHIDGLDPALLRHPKLVSGRVYLPWEVLTFVPRLKPLAKRLLPRDAHAWMNLDTPDTGPLFPYSIEAAVQRTAAEFERTLAVMGEEGGEANVQAFVDLAGT
jgi:hypothetical protein